MDDRRIGWAAGVIGVVFYAIGALIAGPAPKPDAKITTVIVHYSDKRAGVMFGSLLAGLALLFLVCFVAYLRELLAESEEEGHPLATVTVVAWVLLIAIIAVGGAPLAALTWRGVGHADPKIVQMAFDMNNLSLYALSAPAALLSVLAPILVFWRTGLVPRWIVYLGVVEIAVNVVELGGTATRTGFDAAGYAAGLGPIVWVVWVAAVGIVLFTRGRAARPAGAPA